MIQISEVVHTGDAHLEINSSVLEIFTVMHPDEEIIFYAENSQLEAVASKLQHTQKIEFMSFNKYYELQSFSWPARIIGEIKQIYKALRIAKNKNSRIIVWTCLFPTGHLFLNIYRKLFKNDPTHLIVLHGELEFIKPRREKRSEVILGKMLKAAIRVSGKKVKYIVMGDRIKTHLEIFFSEKVLDRVISILHPYHYDSTIGLPIPRIETISDKRPLVMGSVGKQLLSKNSNLIFALAESFKEDIELNKINFITIGQVLPELLPFKNNYVEQIYPDIFIPQSSFDREIEKLDFVLFFYNNNSYQLTASGAIFEVIKKGVPIISIRNDYFDWLFERFYPMGFLCENLHEMRTLIQNIIEGKLDSQIQMIKQHISQFRIENDIQSIARNLSTKL